MTVGASRSLQGSISPGQIASYVVHYSDGRTQEIPIVYGKDVKSRWFDPRQKSEFDNPKVAWVSPPDKLGTAGKSLRLYQKSWKNPTPDSEVKSISFISHMTESAPFLVGITLEP